MVRRQLVTITGLIYCVFESCEGFLTTAAPSLALKPHCRPPDAVLDTDFRLCHVFVFAQIAGKEMIGGSKISAASFCPKTFSNIRLLSWLLFLGGYDMNRKARQNSLRIISAVSCLFFCTTLAVQRTLDDALLRFRGE